MIYFVLINYILYITLEEITFTRSENKHGISVLVRLIC
jgi:hypothetical protein